MIERLKKWYVKYPAAFVAGALAAHIFPLSTYLPDWVVRIIAALHGG